MYKRKNVFGWHKANEYNLYILPNFQGGKDWEVWKVMIPIFVSEKFAWFLWKMMPA